MPLPGTPGQTQRVVVAGLTSGTQYYFAPKVSDDAEPANVSEVSNIAPAIASGIGETVLQAGLNGYTGCRDAYVESGKPTTNLGTVETSHNQDQFYQSDTVNAAYRPKLVLTDYLEPIPGDINADGGGDVVDLLYFVDSFGTVCQTDRNHDPRTDFNSDGSVDVVDLLTLVENFGR